MKYISAFMILAAVANAAAPTPVPTVIPADILLFVSQATFFGDGTQAAMDAACWAEANGQTLGQEFKAAISNIFGSTPKPYDMVSGINGQVVNINGEKLADNIDDLWPQGVIDVDQYELEAFVLDVDGNISAEPHVWTGSASLTSAAAGADCTGWTSSTAGLGIAGNAAVTDANWWNEFFDFCNGDDGQSGFRPNVVYCIQAYQGAAVLFDPIFNGFDGSNFEFQGLPNQFFNLISNPNFHINAKFVPIEHGTFMGAAGIKIAQNEIYVDANMTISVNGEFVKSTIVEEDFLVKITENLVTVQSGAFAVDLKSVASNRLDIKFYVDAAKVEGGVHGLVGQTLNNLGKTPKQGTDNMGTGVIEGSYSDYIVEGIFGTEFSFSQLGVVSAEASKRGFEGKGLFVANLN